MASDRSITPSTVEAMLATCPTEDEIEQIFLDFNIAFHEARHTETGGGYMHTGTCNPNNDATLREGGAWAVHYQFLRWIAQHTGSLVSEAAKASALTAAKDIKATRFCSVGLPFGNFNPPLKGLLLKHPAYF